MPLNTERFKDVYRSLLKSCVEQQFQMEVNKLELYLHLPEPPFTEIALSS